MVDRQERNRPAFVSHADQARIGREPERAAGERPQQTVQMPHAKGRRRGVQVPGHQHPGTGHGGQGRSQCLPLDDLTLRRIGTAEMDPRQDDGTAVRALGAHPDEVTSPRLVGPCRHGHSAALRQDRGLEPDLDARVRTGGGIGIGAGQDLCDRALRRSVGLLDNHRIAPPVKDGFHGAEGTPIVPEDIGRHHAVGDARRLSRPEQPTGGIRQADGGSVERRGQTSGDADRAKAALGPRRGRSGRSHEPRRDQQGSRAVDEVEPAVDGARQPKARHHHGCEANLRGDRSAQDSERAHGYGVAKSPNPSEAR